MKKRYVKELLGITIAAVLFARLPVYALAGDYYIEDGSITVHAWETGQTVAQGGGSSQEDNEPVISNRNPDTPSDNYVKINADAGQTANVTFKDLNIDNSTTYNDFAVEVYGAGDVNIELDGENKLTSGLGYAGIHKGNDGTLTISATDENASLTANGGSEAAGIGGGKNHPDAKDITITGGNITANGGFLAAGIGGGYHGKGENITITGGLVIATGGANGTGIGGGCDGEGKDIKIEGGEVIAIGGTGGPGIGSVTSHASGDIVTISKDSKVKAAGGTGEKPIAHYVIEVIPDTSGLYSTGFIAYYPSGTTAEQIIKGEVQPTKILVNKEASAGQGTQGGNPGAQGGQQTGPDPAPVNSEAQTPQEASAVGHSSSGSSDGDNSEVKDIPTSSEELAKFLAQTNSTLEAYIKKIEAMAAAGDTEGLNALVSKGVTLETGNWVCFNKKTYTLIERVSELGAPVRISFGYKGIRYSTVIPGKAEIKPTDLCNAEGYCGFLNLIKYYGKEEK